MHLIKDTFVEGGLFAYMVVAAGVIGLAADFLQFVLIRRLDMLLSRGLSMSLLTTWLAAFVAGAQCSFGALAVTIRSNVRKRT